MALFDHKYFIFSLFLLTSALLGRGLVPRQPHPVAAARWSLELRGETTPTRRISELLQKVRKTIPQNGEAFAAPSVQDVTGPCWEALRYEASALGAGDQRSTTLLSSAILSEPSLKDAIIDYVCNELAVQTPVLAPTQLRNQFLQLCDEDPAIVNVWALDLMASALRDSSQPNAVSVLLFNKGFHGLVTYRIAHALWNSGRDGLARLFQSMASRSFNMDIHPACSIGHGCYISSAAVIVIGETARLGNDCTIMHDVTLGGTGKESGDRHPKVGDGVYLGPGATVLGNIKVGNGAVVDAGSVVVRDVEQFTRVGGVPATVRAKFDIDSEILDEMAKVRYIPRAAAGNSTKVFVPPTIRYCYHGGGGLNLGM